MPGTRKHRATGKKPTGGARPGAGRPEGSKGILEYGAVQALKTARFKVPENASPEAAELAGEGLESIVKVMRGEVHYMQAGHTLKAATRIREEICGPLTQKVEHAGANGGPLIIEIKKITAEQASGEDDDSPGNAGTS